jgi:hypothetical protein
MFKSDSTSARTHTYDRDRPVRILDRHVTHAAIRGQTRCAKLPFDRFHLPVTFPSVRPNRSRVNIIVASLLCRDTHVPYVHVRTRTGRQGLFTRPPYVDDRSADGRGGSRTYGAPVVAYLIKLCSVAEDNPRCGSTSHRPAAWAIRPSRAAV